MRNAWVRGGLFRPYLLSTLALASWGLSGAAAAAEPSASPPEPAPTVGDVDLRERLTEREDKRRPKTPWSRELAGRPLTVSGQYELELASIRRQVMGSGVQEPDRLLLAHGFELEVFYSFGTSLSLFGQLRGQLEQDLLDDGLEELSDYYLERGEMWLYTEGIAGTHVNLDLGRLDFEDDRTWWWDEELDAVRVAYETEAFELSLALARELAPARSDHDHVDPQHDRVLRLFGEVSWDWRPNHALELTMLYQNDHSSSERVGDIVSDEREDESDARLTWLGARLTGVMDLRSRGILGYWLDTATVRGEERLIEFDALSPDWSQAQGVTRRDVSGWAMDVGLSWMLPLAWEPRVFGGYAFGSGDSTPDNGADRSFRQTGIHSNESGFGGVERFGRYGVLLDPELSNLAVSTVGVGFSLLQSSSLDLVYHRYRQVEPASSLRDSLLEVELTGADRDLGQEIDLVLAIEEWERFELQLVVSGFRAARAFGPRRGDWSYLGYLAVRWAF